MLAAANACSALRLCPLLRPRSGDWPDSLESSYCSPTDLNLRVLVYHVKSKINRQYAGLSSVKSSCIA